MKTTISRELLNSAVSSVGGLPKANSINPVLAHIRCQSHKGFLVFTGSDGEMFASSRVAHEAEEFDILLPAEQLVPLIASFPADEVRVEINESQAVLTGGKGRYKLPVLQGEFPSARPGDEILMAKLPVGTLRRRLVGAMPAVNVGSKEYPWARGPLVAVEGREFVIRGCDSYRLHTFCEAGLDVHAEAHAIPHGDSVAKLLRMLPDAEDIEASVSRDHQSLLVRWGNCAARLPLIDSAVPNYRAMIRADSPARIRVEMKPFLAALNRLLKLIRSKDLLPAVDVEGRESAVILTAAGPQGLTAGEEEVEASTSTPVAAFTVNPIYLIDALACVAGESAWLDVESGKAIQVGGPRSPEFVGVIMPIPPR